MWYPPCFYDCGEQYNKNLRQYQMEREGKAEDGEREKECVFLSELRA